MPGYISKHPGLPHFNYSARVFGDYMGVVFNVDQNILNMRINATAASTVAPGSICVGCHHLLTPLAYQRSGWADDGGYKGGFDDAGAPIDDTDRNLVPDYPYKGKGLEAFSTVAIRKEAFLRRSFDTQFQFLYGRPMRYDQDERVLYRQLWLSAFGTGGNTKALVKIIATNPSYLGNP
jgi:hypothetical protein